MRFRAMRFLACVAMAVLSSCTPTPAPKAERAVTVKEMVAAPPVPPRPATLTTKEIAGIRFEGVSFDSRMHRLMVADQPGGPGSIFPDAHSAATSTGAIAAINAGFFTPEGAPLGLVVSKGASAGAWNTASSLGSGAWHQDSNGRSAISRREKLGKARAIAMKECLQAGPMLADSGKAVSGLEATKVSIRTIILWDGGSRWWIGCGSACTLDALAKALASGQPAGWKPRQALNLDGGRSSDLYVSEKIPGGPLVRRPGWNRPVRNFLVLVPR